MRARSFVWASAGLVLLGARLGAAETGALLPGAWLGAGAPSPVAASTKFVVEAADLAAGVELPLTGGDAQLAVLSRGEPVAEVRLEDASGLSHLASTPGDGRSERFREPVLESFDLPADGLALAVRSLPAGRYLLRSDAATDPAVVVVNELASRLVLEVRTTPLAARAGEPVTVEAFLRDDGRAVGRAQVVAHPEGGGAPLRLREIAPGHFTAAVPTRGGRSLAPLSFRVEAAGTTAAGESFRRTALTGAMVSPGRADLAVDRILFDGESVTVPVRGGAGEYRLEAVFGRSAGEEAVAVAFSREDFALDRAGATLVGLPIPQEAAGADRVVLRLLDRTRLAVEREVEIALAIPGVAVASPAEELLPPAGKRDAAALHGDERD